MVRLRGEELWVAGCVQAALHGVTVGQHDDNTTPNAHDLDLSVGGSRTFGAMEVTAAANAKLVECFRHLDRRGGRWIFPGLADGWSIHVRPDARVDLLYRELPLLLQALEQIGATNIPRQAARSPLTVRADELGVVSAYQGGTSVPGSVYVMPEIPPDRRVGWVAPTGNSLSEWVAEWIIEPSRSDDIEKLRRSAARERHLFVIVPGISSTAPFSVTDLLRRADAPLPTVSPKLPSEVTHVWVMSGWSGGQGFRWSLDDGWQRFANDAVLDLSALAGCTCR